MLDPARLDEQPQLEEVVGYRRSPSDVLRLISFGLVTVALLGLIRWAESTVRGVESDVLALFSGLDPTAARVINGFLTLGVALIAIAVFIPPIALKRYRLIGYIILANLASAAAIALINWWLQNTLPDLASRVLAPEGALGPGAALNPSALAQLTSSFVILAPFVGTRWRRTGAIVLASFTLAHLILAAHLPAQIFTALAVGATVGAAVLLAFGRPDRRATPYAICTGLASAGLDVVALEPFTAHTDGITRCVATVAGGDRLLTKVLSPDERSADLLFRIYRYLRLKNVGDERPFTSLRRSVEHEALVALQARDVGARTPRMRAIVKIGDDSMLLAYDFLESRTLGDLDDGELSDQLLDDIWQQVSDLRAHRIAHRDLWRAHILVDTDGAAWITDFAFSEVAASDAALDSDVAQMLALLAITVGTDRAVRSALDSLGVEALGRALPRLQPNALSGETRSRLKDRSGLLEELQDTIAERTGVDEPEYVPLERLSRRTIFTAVMLVAATYFLFPQLADLPGIFRQIGEADWGWASLVVLFSAVTYVGAAASLGGSVPDRVRAVPTLLAQVAASFASNLAPAGVGGMALNVRYLQKTGVDPPVAVSSVGLNTIAGFAVHVAFLIVLFVWSDHSRLGSLSLPDWPLILLGVGALVVVAAAALAIRSVRRLVTTRLVPILARSMTGFGSVIRSPAKIGLLLGGSSLVTLGYVLAVYFATVAFGGTLSFAQVGAVYLAGSAVAAAAPTPGGLGALEAAVIAGLVGAGMESAAAVPAVFLFRLATFWLPILPGWWAFHRLRGEGYL